MTSSDGRPPKSVAIVQSNYIPWKGYFDLINTVDEFILYDDCQYTRQDWRNRNRLKTSTGTRWLTIPVTVNNLYEQRLDETETADPRWAERHWDTIRQAYRTAPHFADHAPAIEAAYEACGAEPRLTRINRILLETICEILHIETPLTSSTSYAATGTRTQRVVSLCVAAGASTYLSGPRARSYIDASLFAAEGIELRYFDYDGYPEYPQLHPPFDHNVTVLDLLFNVGDGAPSFMKSFAASEP